MVKKWNEETMKEYVEVTSNSGYSFIKLLENETDNRIVVRCDKGHEYEVRFYNFKTGYRCPYCSNSLKHDLNYAKEVFKKQNYEILQDFYVNSKTKIKCKCSKGHEIEISLDNFQRGKRCRYCSMNLFYNEDEVFEEISKTNFMLLDKLKNLSLNNKYNFVDSEGYKYYTHLGTILTSNSSNKFINSNPYSIYNIKLWLQKENIDKEYILISTKYTKKTDELEFMYIGNVWNFEEKDRNFKIIFHDFYYSKKHPLIRISLGETCVKKFLNQNNIEFIKEKTFDGLVYKNKLKIDFYLPYYNIAIEFHGYQHERPVKYFGGEVAFKKQQEKDQIKRDWCFKNNIKLIEIYYDDLKNIETILTKELQLEVKNE